MGCLYNQLKSIIGQFAKQIEQFKQLPWWIRINIYMVYKNVEIICFK